MGRSEKSLNDSSFQSFSALATHPPINYLALALARTVVLFCFSHFSAARSAGDLPPWLASPKNALAFGRHPLVVLR